MLVYFLFGKMLNLFWQICDIVVLILITANGQILKNNPTISSHWSGGMFSDAKWKEKCNKGDSVKNLTNYNNKSHVHFVPNYFTYLGTIL